MVFRYAGVQSVLRGHGRFSSQWAGQVPSQHLPEGAVSAMRKSMVLKDPPEHTRLRTLVNKAFTPRKVAALRTRMEKLPEKDRDQFARWSDASALTIAPILSPEIREGARQGVMEFTAYIRDLTADRRAKPGDDMVSALVRAEVDGESMSDNDVVAMVNLLLAAGNETTRSLLSNAVWLLLSHPAQLGLIREAPSAVPRAVEEVLRFEPPVAMTFRITAAEIRLGDTVIPEGELALAMITSANRALREFSVPDRFDITRSPNRHVGFWRRNSFLPGRAPG